MSRNITKIIKVLFILAAVIQLQACGRISIHKYQAYPEDAHPEDVVVLHVARYVYVQQIDGNGKYSPDYVSDLFPYSGAKISLLPGKHMLVVKYRQGKHYQIVSSGVNNLKYDFKAGQEYFMYGEVVYGKSTTGMSIVYHIGECGTPHEAAFNEKESKNDYMFNPYVPACGLKK